MSQEIRRTPRQAQHNQISYEQRLQLISLVEQEGFTISQAALTLQIKLSTPKLIVARYRQTGTIFRRKSEQPIEKKAQKKLKKRILSRISPPSHTYVPLPLNNQNQEGQLSITSENPKFQTIPIFYLATWPAFQDIWTNCFYF